MKNIEIQTHHSMSAVGSKIVNFAYMQVDKNTSIKYLGNDSNQGGGTSEIKYIGRNKEKEMEEKVIHGIKNGNKNYEKRNTTSREITTIWGKGYRLNRYNQDISSLLHIPKDEDIKEFFMALCIYEYSVKEGECDDEKCFSFISRFVFEKLNPLYPKVTNDIIRYAYYSTYKKYLKNKKLDIIKTFIINLGFMGVYINPTSKTNYSSVVFIQ